MLRTRHVDGTTLVTIEFEGDVTADDLVEVRNRIESVVEHHGSVDLLLEYGRLGALPPRAVWEDLKTTPLVRDVRRAAVVTDQHLVRAAVRATAPLLPCAVELFEPAHRDEAERWVRAD